MNIRLREKIKLCPQIIGLFLFAPFWDNTVFKAIAPVWVRAIKSVKPPSPRLAAQAQHPTIHNNKRLPDSVPLKPSDIFLFCLWQLYDGFGHQ
ncbi:hypothetical protein N7467_004178 [Penicillium canescens]|nr:hypothetical protein N7467_004178 [Penicillium canescens]